MSELLYVEKFCFLSQGVNAELSLLLKCPALKRHYKVGFEQITRGTTTRQHDPPDLDLNLRDLSEQLILNDAEIDELKALPALSVENVHLHMDVSTALSFSLLTMDKDQYAMHRDVLSLFLIELHLVSGVDMVAPSARKVLQ